MKSSELKSIIEYEMFVGVSEMTKRFQYLRDCKLLPNDKGQAARDLSEDEIINGILSVMHVRPSFSSRIVNCTKPLKPVRGLKYSYRGAKTFGKALCLALENPDGLKEIKVKGVENDDKEHMPPSACGGRAQITYEMDGEQKIAYYTHEDSLFKENSRDAIEYDPINLKAWFEREYRLNENIFRRIHCALKQEKQYRQSMKMQA